MRPALTARAQYAAGRPRWRGWRWRFGGVQQVLCCKKPGGVEKARYKQRRQHNVACKSKESSSTRIQGRKHRQRGARLLGEAPHLFEKGLRHHNDVMLSGHDASSLESFPMISGPRDVLALLFYMLSLVGSCTLVSVPH
jgi:hypothetical protein